MRPQVKHDPPLVLVADDEISAATMLKHIFEREGYQVQIAQDGQSALTAAREHMPDLILLDIQMPRMNGFEVLEKLREQEHTLRCCQGPQHRRRRLHFETIRPTGASR